MRIDIPNDDFQMLAQKAVAAGYADVTLFIQALAREPSVDPRGMLDDQAVQESAKLCEQANAEIEAGGGSDARQALLELGRELGFKPPS